jgi:glycosyltransferase involved in cell wall biosynthesis
MKILIWSGYHKTKWDKNTWVENGIGGSEYCVIKLAEYLNSKNHDVTVSGTVEEGNFQGVKYIHYYNFNKYQGPIGMSQPNSLPVYPHYDVVIATNYIHFIKHLNDYNIKFDKAYFWMHNEYFYKWYRGDELKNWSSYFQDTRLKGIVGVSKFHKEYLTNNQTKLFKHSDQQLPPILSIDNAIDLNDYNNVPPQDKIKGRIIWSSSPDRGLDLILSNWNEWKELRPDLSLVICSPPYSSKWFDHDISQLKDVMWLGALNPADLKIEQLRAEYWVYASDYLETYCITALEMMMARVKILTNGTGNIKHLINKGTRGELIDTNPDLIIETLLKDIQSPEFHSNWIWKTEEAYMWARNQNWENRVDEWLSLIQG